MGRGVGGAAGQILLGGTLGVGPVTLGEVSHPEGPRSLGAGWPVVWR